DLHMRMDGEGDFAEQLMMLGAHIPEGHLRASERQRRELLAGVLDAGGTVEADGTVRFESDNPRLLEDIAELIAGLGYTRILDSGSGSFLTDDDVFVLPSKARPHKENGRPVAQERRVVAVRPGPSGPVRCVEVYGEHLYLAGRSMVPTHNS